MSNKVVEISISGAPSDFKSKVSVNDGASNIWEECNSNGVVANAEITNGTVKITPEEQLTEEDMAMIESVWSEEEIQSIESDPIGPVNKSQEIKINESNLTDFEKLTQNEEFIATLGNDNDKNFARTLLLAGYSQEEIFSLIEENNNLIEYNNSIVQIDNYQMEIANELMQKYLSKPIEECSVDEINNVYALFMIDNVLISSQTGLKKQDDSDGVVSETFDFVKELTTLGVCQEDVEGAIEKQEYILNTLKQTLKDGGDFAKVYQELTGVEYNPEKISEYYQKTTELQFVSIGMQKVSAFIQSLEQAKDDTEKMLDLYIEFYGDDELGRQKFEDDLLYSIKNEYLSVRVDDIIITEDNEIINICADGTQENMGNISSLGGRVTLGMRNENALQRKTDEYLANFENATGINYQDLVKEQNELSKEALGDANAVTNLLNDYVASQESFIDGFNTFVQINGMALMAAGSIVSFIPGGQAAGAGMMKVGQILSVAGTFGDEATELLDTATNNNSFAQDNEHYKNISKDLFTDGALFATGYLIGGASNLIANNIKGCRALAKLAEIGFDGSASMLTDLIITGEIDFKGEGFSQILSILTGHAMAKCCATNKVDADINIKNNSQDIDYDSSEFNLGKNDYRSQYSDLDLNKIDWTTDGTYYNDYYDSQNLKESFDISNLTDIETAELSFLYQHFDNLGYGDLLNRHPELLFDVFESENVGLSSYHAIGKADSDIPMIIDKNYSLVKATEIPNIKTESSILQQYNLPPELANNRQAVDALSALGDVHNNTLRQSSSPLEGPFTSGNEYSISNRGLTLIDSSEINNTSSGIRYGVYENESGELILAVDGLQPGNANDISQMVYYLKQNSKLISYNNLPHKVRKYGYGLFDIVSNLIPNIKPNDAQLKEYMNIYEKLYAKAQSEGKTLIVVGYSLGGAMTKSVASAHIGDGTQFYTFNAFGTENIAGLKEADLSNVQNFCISGDSYSNASILKRIWNPGLKRAGTPSTYKDKHSLAAFTHYPQ